MKATEARAQAEQAVRSSVDMREVYAKISAAMAAGQFHCSFGCRWSADQWRIAGEHLSNMGYDVAQHKHNSDTHIVVSWKLAAEGRSGTYVVGAPTYSGGRD